MKKLIQGKQWAELKAYCLDKILAGIENAEVIVDTFIEELAKRAEVSPNPWKSSMDNRPSHHGISTTWRFLGDANPGDVVPVEIADEDMRQAREDSLGAISFAKMDRTPFYTHVALIDNPPDEHCRIQYPEEFRIDISPKSVTGYIVDKSSTGRYSEAQFEGRYKAANNRYLNPKSNFGVPVYQDGCFVMMKEHIEEAQKNGAHLNHEEQEDGTYLVSVAGLSFEEQHSKRLDEEVKELKPSENNCIDCGFVVDWAVDDECPKCGNGTPF